MYLTIFQLSFIDLQQKKLHRFACLLDVCIGNAGYSEVMRSMKIRITNLVALPDV